MKKTTMKTASHFIKGTLSFMLVLLMVFASVAETAGTSNISLFSIAAYAEDSYIYYPRYTGSSQSLVDALKAVGVDSSYANRKAIAAMNGIGNYSGTASQNTQLLNLLKNGRLIKSVAASTDLPVGAYIPEGTYVLYSAVGNNKVLDVNGCGTADGVNIQIWDANGGPSQIYYIFRLSNGWYLIKNASGKVLDVSGAEKKSGANVIQWTWNGGENQQWRFVPDGNGFYYIQNKLGFYLDVNGGASNNGTNVQVWDGNQRDSQRWMLKSPSSLVESNLSRVKYIKQGNKTCKASSVAMAANVIVGVDKYTTSSMGNSSCKSTNGLSYKGSDGATYVSTYKTDSYVGSYNEQQNAIQQALNAGLPIVVAVHSTQRGKTQHHWVVIVGKSGNDYLIVDPASGSSGKMSANTKTMNSAHYAFGLTDYSKTHYGYVTFVKK